MIMQEKAIHKEMVFLKQALSTKDDVIEFAKSEGLDGHANSIAVRFEEE